MYYTEMFENNILKTQYVPNINYDNIMIPDYWFDMKDFWIIKKFTSGLNELVLCWWMNFEPLYIYPKRLKKIIWIDYLKMRIKLENFDINANKNVIQKSESKF